VGWEVPRLLTELEHADDLYMDSMSQIILDSWTRGRVALVGDAGYSPGQAVGGGTSLAIIGAYVLASELVKARGDHLRGFPAYQEALEPVVKQSRLIGPTAIKLIIPNSRRQIWTMAQFMRVIPRFPEAVRRLITTFGGSAGAMLDQAHLSRPEDLPRLG
jgi:2-polyprenyl-6-methoxyphenol hydroxylase-like FAD-dependent oxidoreductase